MTYIGQAIDAYYTIEHYLDEVFDKMPKMPQNILKKAIQSEKQLMRNRNIKLVEEDILIRDMSNLEQPVIDQPVIEQPVIEQPVIEQPVIQQPKKRGRPPTRKIGGKIYTKNTTRKHI